MNRVSLFLLLSLLWTGCSLKENRQDCPASVYLDLSELEYSPVTVCIPSEDIFVSVNLEDSVFFRFETKSRIPVPISVFYGQGQCLAKDGAVQIPYGQEAPLLYTFYSVADLQEREVIMPVDLSKNHCILTLNFLSGSVPGISEFTVTGDVNGYDPGGSVSDGRFKVEVSVDGLEDGASLVLPRQKDDSLILVASFEDRTLRTFALGEYISRSGYDWTAKNLEDLDVFIDLVHYEVFVTSSIWDEPKYFEIEI